MKENLSEKSPEIDFLSKQMDYRRRKASLKNELLARALGKHPNETFTLVDATAGLGRDSFILASLGFSVIMLEREQFIYEALKNALERAHLALPDIVARIQLIHADAIQWLPLHHEKLKIDTIYLDPMFPTRKKTALVKKSMAILQELLGKSSDHALLFKTALTCAQRRVIVKRPRSADKIDENAVNFCLNGTTSRFDVYQR